MVLGTDRFPSRKVKAILEWPMPTKVTELRSFLGLANYYRPFIGYSKKVVVLTDLLKKDQKRFWSPDCQMAFDKLKRAISSEPVLKLPEFDKPFKAETDASDRTIGGVLVQEDRQVAFESFKLNETEQPFTVHEKEMTALVHCLRLWRHFLLGGKFEIQTDNLAMSYFDTQKKRN